MSSNHDHQISNQQCHKYLVSTPQFWLTLSLCTQNLSVCVVM